MVGEELGGPFPIAGIEALAGVVPHAAYFTWARPIGHPVGARNQFLQVANGLIGGDIVGIEQLFCRGLLLPNELKNAVLLLAAGGILWEEADAAVERVVIEGLGDAGIEMVGGALPNARDALGGNGKEEALLRGLVAVAGKDVGHPVIALGRLPPRDVGGLPGTVAPVGHRLGRGLRGAHRVEVCARLQNLKRRPGGTIRLQFHRTALPRIASLVGARFEPKELREFRRTRITDHDPRLARHARLDLRNDRNRRRVAVDEDEEFVRGADIESVVGDEVGLDAGIVVPALYVSGKLVGEASLALLHGKDGIHHGNLCCRENAPDQERNGQDESAQSVMPCDDK